MSPTEEVWLEALRDDLAGITERAAEQFWPSPERDCPPYFNYRLEHVRQVEREAVRLLSVVGGDRDIVLASVWVHDRFQPVFRGPEEHGKRAAEWAREHLATMGFPAEKVEPVCFAVANHSNPPGTISPEAHEARVLWDADKLTKVGAVNLLFTFLNSYMASDRLQAVCSDPGFPGRTLTMESIARNHSRRHPRQASPGGHFYFEPSRRWAAERWGVEESFYELLSREVGERPCRCDRSLSDLSIPTPQVVE